MKILIISFKRNNKENIQKKILFLGFIILYLLLPNPGHACDMMALISLSGHTISEQIEIPGDFNDPFDFYEFMKERSDPLINDDGYGILYYKDGEVLIDSTQKWFKTGNGCWYGDGSDEPLDTAINEIMDENNNAVIILGHVREAGPGYGSHPFTFESQNTTYTLMHNGTLGNSIKNALMNYLGEDWFIQHPSNWEGQYGNVNSFIDSELLFHYIMSHILANDGDIMSGIYTALNNRDVEGYNLRERFSNAQSIINFIFSDGISLYIFRNSLPSNTRNLCYEIYDTGFIGIKTIDSLENQILTNTLAIISREEEPLHISYYNPQFSVVPNSGNMPLEVNFIDVSNGDPVSWQWDFQNDGSYDSFEQNPYFVYEQSGLYDVKLKISDGVFVDSLVKVNYITVFDTVFVEIPSFYLQQNYPNPFNTETTIRFTTIERSPAFDGNTSLRNATAWQAEKNTELVIYNLKGQKVKTLVNDVLPAGEHSAIWDGKNYNQYPVASGLYFYKLKTSNKSKIRKMVLLR